VRLILSSSDFVVGGVPRPGFPLLFDRDMELVPRANEFLIYFLLHRGSVGSKKSWVTLGQHMYDYFGFLEAYDRRWDELWNGAGTSVVADYRDYALDLVGNARSTVSQRLSTVVAFYRFALKKSWIQTLPFYETEGVGKNSETRDEDHHGGRPLTDIAISVDDEPIEFLTMEQIQLLLLRAQNPTHRMMIRLALQLGLRRQEISTLRVIHAQDPHSIRGPLGISLDPREVALKGGRKRFVSASRRLLSDLWHYLVHERSVRTDSRHPTDHLLLTEQGRPWSREGAGFHNILAGYSRKLGFKVYPHILRHTYATHTLHALQETKSNIDAVVFLKAQLGHKSIRTTLRYLHVVNRNAEALALSYDEEVTRMSESAPEAV